MMIFYFCFVEASENFLNNFFNWFFIFGKEERNYKIFTVFFLEKSKPKSPLSSIKTYDAMISQPMLRLSSVNNTR